MQNVRLRNWINSAVTTMIVGFMVVDFSALSQNVVPLVSPVSSGSGFRVAEVIVARKTQDFSISGDGSDQAWVESGWNIMTKLDAAGRNYESKFKVLYSPTGLYVLFQGADDKITSENYQDFDPIFHGDVFEVFLHPDPAVQIYFEYEVNALDKELILAISNLNGKNYSSWMPFGKNKSGVKKMVKVEGGKGSVGASISAWKAEIFLPYGVLGLLPGIPPKSGDTWNANFCRLDYDSGQMVKWSWSPGIKKSFHELDQFLSLKFE